MSDAIYKGTFLTWSGARRKIEQFRSLFDGEWPIVTVYGNFKDKKGNIAFLNGGKLVSAAEVANVRGNYLKIMCDGEYHKLTPTHNFEGKWPRLELTRERRSSYL